MSKPLTLVVVGDALSKKTELLYKYTCNKHFYKYYMPQYYQDTERDIIVDHIPYTVTFIAAETDEDYLLLRLEAYKKADAIILCYSIKYRQTFENMLKKWCADVRKCKPNVPVILVATDTEVRCKRKPRKHYVTEQEGEDLKFALNACALVECSVEKLVGIDDVFIEAVRSTYCSTCALHNFYHKH